MNEVDGFLLGEDILLAMLTLGFDSYVEPLRTFLTKVRDASKYDRTITMGGDLTDDIRMQVNQSGGQMAQAQVATTVQVQPNSATGAAATTATNNPNNSSPAVAGNGLEPYGHSVGARRSSLRERSAELCFRFVW